MSRHRENATLLAQAVSLLRKAKSTHENKLALGLALCYHAVSLAMTEQREAASSLAQEGLSLLLTLGHGRELALGHILTVVAGVPVDETHAKPLLEQALTLSQEADRPLEACWARNLLALIALRYGQYDQAEGYLLTSLRIASEIDHPRGEALLLSSLGQVAYARGQYARAIAFLEQSLTVFRELGERAWSVSHLSVLGEVALASGNLEQARARYQEALSESEERAGLADIARALCGLGEVALAAGEVPAARRHYRRVLQVALEDQRAATGRESLFSLARWYTHKGERELAVELVTLALNVRPNFLRVRFRGAEAFLSELRSELSPEAYAAAQARGRARDLKATIRELLAEL